MAKHVKVLPRVKRRKIFIAPDAFLASTKDEPVHLTLETVTSLFELTMAEAAAKIGICVTAFKHACRKLGITRWPRRFLREYPTTTTPVMADGTRSIDDDLHEYPSSAWDFSDIDAIFGHPGGGL